VIDKLVVQFLISNFQLLDCYWSRK